MQRLKRVEHSWTTNIWISSGYDEPGAQQTRAKTFRKAMHQSSAGTFDWLRRLHRSHAPDCGPYSVCMHRNDAVTVSYTEIMVSPKSAIMRYHAGSACEALRKTGLSLVFDDTKRV